MRSRLLAFRGFVPEASAELAAIPVERKYASEFGVIETAADGRIIGVARDDLSDDQYRELIQSRFKAVEGAKRPSEEEF